MPPKAFRGSKSCPSPMLVRWLCKQIFLIRFCKFPVLDAGTFVVLSSFQGFEIGGANSMERQQHQGRWLKIIPSIHFIIFLLAAAQWRPPLRARQLQAHHRPSDSESTPSRLCGCNGRSPNRLAVAGEH